MGSNGLTSARHDVFNQHLTEKFPESYDDIIPSRLVYTGKYNVTDKISELNTTVGKLLLYPTRTYGPVIKKVLEQYRSDIHGMIHCTGGAQTKVMKFVENMHVIKDNLFELPPLFRIIREQSETSWEEMYEVFNMGHRFEIYGSQELADAVIKIAADMGVEAKVIGRCEAAENNKLTISSEFGEFVY